LIRNHIRHFQKTQHVRLTCRIWYWHFVDGVWIVVYILLYWLPYFAVNSPKVFVWLTRIVIGCKNKELNEANMKRVEIVYGILYM
jgi:hypothetical protein